VLEYLCMNRQGQTGGWVPPAKQSPSFRPSRRRRSEIRRAAPARAPAAFCSKVGGAASGPGSAEGLCPLLGQRSRLALAGNGPKAQSAFSAGGGWDMLRPIGWFAAGRSGRQPHLVLPQYPTD